MQSKAAADEILGRGVYKAPYLVDGVEVLIAIDARGAARKHLKLRPGVSEHRATAWLREWLDRIDPRPTLKLVTSAPPVQTVPVAAYDDGRAYERRLAKRAAGKIRLFRDD